MLVEGVEVVIPLEVVDVGVELMLSMTLLFFPILRLPLSVFSKLEDPPVGDPPAQDPPVRDPPIHVVEDPDEIDEVMAGRVIWRFLQRAGGPHLEALRLRFLRGC
ncbi:hypothetical protein V6N13_133755 [Hibiscus sabdariffa]